MLHYINTLHYRFQMKYMLLLTIFTDLIQYLHFMDFQEAVVSLQMLNVLEINY